MTLRTNARVAGVMFLAYIAIGVTTMVLFNRATADAAGTGATLASLAAHAPMVRLTALLTLVTFVIAVVLAVTLYALTRHQDHHLAMLALCCRATEGVLAASGAVRTLGLLSVATASVAAAATDAGATHALGGLLLEQGGAGTLVAATVFAVGSTLYAYLFLRARSIPVPLAWLGVIASVLLLVALPLQLAEVLQGPMTYGVWIPMAVFEITLALWLIVKGVTAPPDEHHPPLATGAPA